MCQIVPQATTLPSPEAGAESEKGRAWLSKQIQLNPGLLLSMRQGFESYMNPFKLVGSVSDETFMLSKRAKLPSHGHDKQMCLPNPLFLNHHQALNCARSLSKCLGEGTDSGFLFTTNITLSVPLGTAWFCFCSNMPLYFGDFIYYLSELPLSSLC